MEGGGYSDEHNKTNRKLIDISIVYENLFNMVTSNGVILLNIYCVNLGLYTIEMLINKLL